jgi:hypothetical protein
MPRPCEAEGVPLRSTRNSTPTQSPSPQQCSVARQSSVSDHHVTSQARLSQHHQQTKSVPSSISPKGEMPRPCEAEGVPFRTTFDALQSKCPRLNKPPDTRVTLILYRPCSNPLTPATQTAHTTASRPPAPSRSQSPAQLHHTTPPSARDQ